MDKNAAQEKLLAAAKALVNGDGRTLDPYGFLERLHALKLAVRVVETFR